MYPWKQHAAISWAVSFFYKWVWFLAILFGTFALSATSTHTHTHTQQHLNPPTCSQIVFFRIWGDICPVADWTRHRGEFETSLIEILVCISDRSQFLFLTLLSLALITFYLPFLWVVLLAAWTRWGWPFVILLSPTMHCCTVFVALFTFDPVSHCNLGSILSSSSLWAASTDTFISL